MRKMTPSTVLIAFLVLNALSMLIYTILPNKEVCREAPFNEQVIAKQKAPSFSRLPVDLSKELSSASFVLHTNSTYTAVPDLRSQILYYGSLLRPDSEEKSPLLHLTLRGDSEQIFVRANTPLYLRYDQGKNQWKKAVMLKRAIKSPRSFVT